MEVKTIITTVGTSLISNFKDKYPNENLYALGNEEEKEKPASFDDYESFKEILVEEGVYEKLKEFALNDFPKTSAELTSIYKLKEKYQDNDFIIYLLTSDTFEGYFIGEILKEVLEEKTEFFRILDIKLEFIKGLQVNNEEFLKEEGFLNLFKTIDEVINSYYYKNIILNITGGYKGIAPLVSIIGQINKVPSYYIFENSDVLIQLPTLPINIDWSLFAKYQKVFEDLEKDFIEDWGKYKKENNIRDFQTTLIETINENGKTVACLNFIGRFLYRKFKNSLIIKIYKNREWIKKETKNIKEINKAFLELYERLQERIKNENIENTKGLIEYIKKLPDTDDLKHGGNLDKDSFIFKSTNQNQIRVVYSPIYENGYLSFKVFEVLRHNFNHSTYIEELKKEMELLDFSEDDFIDYPINKEDKNV